MSMNKLLATGAALSFATFFLHVFGGGPEFPQIIFATEALPAKQKALYGVLWHMVSAYLLLASASYAIASVKSTFAPAVYAVNALNVSIAVLFLYYGITSLGDIWTLPQWVIFTALVGLTQWPYLRSTPELSQTA